MKTAVKVILRLYIGEITLMKTAVKVILRFYIGGDNTDKDSCESNIKVLYRGR
jgi:hypothetical protein